MKVTNLDIVKELDAYKNEPSVAHGKTIEAMIWCMISDFPYLGKREGKDITQSGAPYNVIFNIPILPYLRNFNLVHGLRPEDSLIRIEQCKEGFSCELETEEGLVEYFSEFQIIAELGACLFAWKK